MSAIRRRSSTRRRPFQRFCGGCKNARGVRPQTQIPLPLSRRNGFGVLRAERRVLYVPERGEHGCGRRNLCREAYTRIQGLLPRRHSLWRSGLLPHQDKLCLRYGTDRKRRRAYGEVCKTAALGNEIIKNALKVINF